VNLEGDKLVGAFSDESRLVREGRLTHAEAICSEILRIRRIVTRVGEAFAARMAGGILHSLGLSELATASDGEFRAKALRLALQPDVLRTVKNRSSVARHRAAVFDTTRFRSHLERAFETMCRIRDRGESPAGFTVQSD
jgi:protein O-GlcNAc transferase